MLKKITAMMLALTICLSVTACRYQKEETTEYQLNIVVSIFPYYDIARALTSGVEDVKVSMAVSPGLDSHTFEPTPKDIKRIENADVFIYNGGTMEEWVKNILSSVKPKGQIAVCMMDEVDPARILESDEREELYGEVHEEEGEEEEELDEHIWTSPVLMMEMTDIVLDTLCQKDPQHTEQYQKNAEVYKQNLERLDTDLKEVVDNARVKEFIFADKFPLLYFAKEYGLDYYAAFPGCSSDMEPSAKTVAFLEDKIREEKVRAIFYLELSSHTVADTISEDTGAATMQFNSCHNVTQKQFDEGVTYLELMKENVKSLEMAMN